MLKIKILTVGKIKEHWLKTALFEYEKRLTSSVKIDWLLAKDDDELSSLMQKESFLICLDPLGEELTSETFSKKLCSLWELHKSSLSFLIGGPAGILKKHLPQNSLLISFSRLTFTHQMIRLLLVEQIYRALEIEKGSPYHK